MRKHFLVLLAVGLMASPAFAQGIHWAAGAPGGPTPGGALDFGGGNGSRSFVNVADLNVVPNFHESDYTMSLWLSPDSIPGESFFLGQTNQGIHHGLRDSGKLHQAHWGADHSGDTTVPTGDGTDASHWVHATFTWDSAGELGQIYFNGVADTAAPVAKRAPNGDGNFIIGSRNGAGGPAFDGQIDEVAVWSSILPQADITALAAGGSANAASTAPLAYWTFEEGSGLSTADVSTAGNNYTGTFLDPPPPGESAMELAMGNWNARVIGLADAGADSEVNDHTEARNIIAFADGGANPNGWEISQDDSDMRNRIDMAGGGGNFPHNHVYPDGTTAPNGNGEDFVVQVTTKERFHIPEGDWTIAFGSDDGGMVQVEGVTFLSEWNTSGDDVLDDTAFFDGNRGHGWTGGTFSVGPGGMDVHVEASMHERGGGDSFELAIANDHFEGFDGNGFFLTLAGEGEFGINVVPEPSSTILLGMGLAALGLFRRRRSR